MATVLWLWNGLMGQPVAAQFERPAGAPSRIETSGANTATIPAKVIDDSPPGPSPGVPSESSGDSRSVSRTPIRRAEEPGAGSLRRSDRGSIWSTVAMLSVVVGLSAVGIRVYRRQSRSGDRTSRHEIVRLIANRRLDGQSSVHVLQIGGRVLVVGAGSGGMTTLATFENPREIEQVLHGEQDPAAPRPQARLFEGRGVSGAGYSRSTAGIAREGSDREADKQSGTPQEVRRV
ncbi:MAG: hypothetical protein DWQ29_19285 [Planctomycetota bacterium]|nr:MAG: hypothetical protein DWQ29_19285 [Planctomycetota bacterium]